MVTCVLDKDFLIKNHNEFWRSNEFRAVKNPQSIAEEISRKNLVAEYAATLETNPKFAAEVARSAQRRAQLLTGIILPVLSLILNHSRK